MATQERMIDNITSRPQTVRVSPQRGALAWGLQRVSAYGLLLFVAVHMWFNYYGPALRNTGLSFEVINQRFYTYPLIYAFNNIGLLACALYHGLYGVRSIAYDLITNQTVRRIITVGLIVIGLLFLVDGSLTLLALMTLEP